MTDKVQKILSEIATRKLCTMDEHMAFYNDKAKEDYRFLSEIEEIIKGMQEEPVSEDLEEAAMMHYKDVMERKIITGLETANITSFKAGANWQKEQMMKDYTNLCNGIATVKGLAVTMAYDKGMSDAREQMMTKAVDGYVIEDIEEGNGDFLLSADYLPKSMNLKDQQRVKVIVIKEE